MEKEKKTFRITLTQVEEVDVIADSLEEAKEIAQEDNDWSVVEDSLTGGEVSYQKLLFLDGDEDTDSVLDMINEDGEEEAILYLIMNYSAAVEIPEESIGKPWGTNDTTYQKRDMILAYNFDLHYVSLQKEVVKVSEEEKKATVSID